MRLTPTHGESNVVLIKCGVRWRRRGGGPGLALGIGEINVHVFIPICLGDGKGARVERSCQDSLRSIDQVGKVSQLLHEERGTPPSSPSIALCVSPPQPSPPNSPKALQEQNVLDYMDIMLFRQYCLTFTPMVVSTKQCKSQLFGSSFGVTLTRGSNQQPSSCRASRSTSGATAAR